MKIMMFLIVLFLLAMPYTLLADYGPSEYYTTYYWVTGLYNPDGTLQWENNFEWYERAKNVSTYDTMIKAVNIDKQNDIYIFGDIEDDRPAFLQINATGAGHWSKTNVGNLAAIDGNGNTFTVIENEIGVSLKKILDNGATQWELSEFKGIFALMPTEDGGVYAIGETINDNTQGKVLVRYDTNGSLLQRSDWLAGIFNNETDFLILTTGGGLIAAIKDDNCYLLQLVNLDGSLVWTKKTENFAVHSLTIDSQGNVLVSGAIIVDGAWQTIIAKYAAENGEILWTQTISNYSPIKTIICEQDSLAIILAAEKAFSWSLYVYKLDADGIEQWLSKELYWLKDSFGEVAKKADLIYLPGPTIVSVSLESSSTIQLVGLDNDGTIHWAKNHHSIDQDSEVGSIKLMPTHSGNFYLVCNSFIEHEVHSGGGVDDDPIYDGDDDNDDDAFFSDSCGCAVGTTDPTVPLVAVMLLIGLIAMAVSLRRK